MVDRKWEQGTSGIGGPENGNGRSWQVGEVYGEVRHTPEGVPYVERVLVTPEMIDAQLTVDAEWVESEFAGKNVLFVPVYLGAGTIGGELMQRVELPDLEMDGIRVKSYNGGTESNGEPEVVWGVQAKVDGRHVLLIEDVTHTGHTIGFLRRHFNTAGAASTTIYSFADKPDQREVDEHPDRVGFTLPPVWLERFGMDTGGLNRNGGLVTYRDLMLD